MTTDPSGHIQAIVVEDELKIGTYIKHKIEYLDSSISIAGVAENGREALKLIEQFEPQVVFTDISMPVMDGLELSRIIRNTYPGLIVVIISGYSDFTYAQKAMQYGVFNYILKPLEDEKLSDVLLEIKKSLVYTKSKHERQVLYSDTYMFLQTSGMQYAIFSLCIGNLLYDIEDTVLTEYYQKELRDIPWKKIMEELCQDGYNWYLADEQAVNQKIVGIQMQDRSIQKTEKLAERLLELLKPWTRLAIHIGHSGKILEYECVWNMTKHLRHVMHQELIIGCPQILTVEKQNGGNQDMLEIVKMKLSSYIKNYFLSTDLKSFTNEIQTVLKYMIQNRAPQLSIEKVSIYVLKLLEFSSQIYEGNFLETMQIKQQRCISLATTGEELISLMMEGFQEIGCCMDQIYEKNLDTKVLEYVDNNFLTLESLEQVADVFGYNYTYLSRLFKKMSGMPMNKYITEKKIALARKLLKEQPDLILEEVCELCGYNDCRYFSRVFKSLTGVTPSEYRTGEKKEEEDCPFTAKPMQCNYD